jgi:uncharacterized protein YgiM (DUF1202 family)
MKHFLAFLFTFIFFIVSYAQRTCINASTLNLRSKPNTNSTVIQALTRGTEVLVQYKENAEWSYISVNGKSGYVFHQYLGSCNTNTGNYNSSGNNKNTGTTPTNRNSNGTYPSNKAQTANQTVYICNSKNAYAYHKNHNCSGLNRCKAGKSQTTSSNATSIGYQPCKICY